MPKVRIRKGGIYAPLFREAVTLTNLIYNGNFSKGTDGWNVSGPGGIVNGYQSMEPGGTSIITTNSSHLLPQPIVGHKYYWRRKYQRPDGPVSADDARFEWYSGDGEGKNFVFANNTTASSASTSWYIQDGIIAPTTVVNSSRWIIRCFTVNASNKFYSGEMLLVDLTEAFGAGNEPDKNWCLSNICRYDDGTYTTHFNSSNITGTKRTPIQIISTGEIRGYKLIEDESYTIPAQISASLTNANYPALATKEFRECIVLKNLVPYGDMSTGWNIGTNIVYDTSRKKYGSQSLKLTGLSSAYENVVATKDYIPLIPSHIYYGRMEGYQNSKSGSGTQIYWPIAEPAMGSVPLKSAGSWQIYSFRTDRSSFSAGNYQFRLDYDNNQQAGEIWFDGAMLIDLTAGFGAGSEPTQEWCDANIPFFSGTKIYNDLDSYIWTV